MYRLARVLVIPVLVLAACGDGETAETTTTTSPPSTTMPTTTSSLSTTTAPQVPPIGTFETPPLSSAGFPASGPAALFEDLRHAPHDGFERVVFEFRSGESVSYELRYVEQAVPPSGEPVDVAGDAILQVTMTPASGMELSGNELMEVYEGPDRLTPADSELIAEMVLVEDFENVLVWAIGLPDQRRAAVALLEGPLRLVVDVPTG